MADITTKIPAVPVRTPTHTGDADKPTLSRQWVIFFEQLVGALAGIGGEVGAGSSGTITMSVEGTLAIGSDLAPRIAPLNAVTPKGVTALVKAAPTGADLTFNASYLKNGSWTVWMTLTVTAGSLSATANAAMLTAAGVLPAALPVSLNITACGTIFPGADLTLLVYY